MESKVGVDWRPTNWEWIKKRILEESRPVFSPSSGYSGDTKDAIIEKTASAILEELERECVIVQDGQNG